MARYIVRRLMYMLILLIVTSFTSYVIIQMPPGDWLTAYIARLELSGQSVGEAQVATLTKQYGLDLPFFQRYIKWIWDFLHGDFGNSFTHSRPVSELIAERLPITIGISLSSLVFSYLGGILIGVYSATHQYSAGDYAFTILGFIGLATPNFLLALIVMFVFYRYFGLSIGGLWSSKFMAEPMNWAKFVDLLKHLPAPIIVIGLAGTAALIRVMRACLLDELAKQYVITAKAKGLKERKLLFKYPVRIALNPIISTIGWLLPAIVSGSTIVSVVLNLPTTGPLLLEALITQDMYLAGSIIMLLTFLTVLGTLVSDILLAVVDPRIRLER